MLTFLPLEQIEEMAKWEGNQINQAKEILAYELTKLVHSEDDAIKALEAARALFSGNISSNNMPTTQLDASDFQDGHISLLDLLVKTKLAPSKGEARRLVEQGGITVDDEKISDTKVLIQSSQFEKGYILIKKGKKVFHKVML